MLERNSLCVFDWTDEAYEGTTRNPDMIDMRMVASLQGVLQAS